MTLGTKAPSTQAQNLAFTAKNSVSLTAVETCNSFEKLFSIFLKHENEDRALNGLRKLLGQVSQINFQLAVKNLSYKILEEVNRNVHLATCFVQENLGEISRNNGNDVITLDIEKRKLNIGRLIDFLEKADSLRLLDEDLVLNFLEVTEILAFNSVLRKTQKKFWVPKDVRFGDNLGADSLFRDAVRMCLRDWSVVYNENSATENIDKLFLNLSKNYEILNKMIEIYGALWELPTATEKDKKDMLLVLCKLLIKGFTQIHNSRQEFFEKFALTKLRPSWWLHSETLMFDSSVKVLGFMKSNTLCSNTMTMELEQPFTPEEQELRQKAETIDNSFRAFSKLMLMEYFYMAQYGGVGNQSLVKCKGAVIEMMLEKEYLEDLYEIALKTRDYDLVCRLNFVNGYKQIELEKLFRDWEAPGQGEFGDIGGFLEFWVRYGLELLKSSEPDLIPSQIATRQFSYYLANPNTQYVTKTILTQSPQIAL
jgi:hypothetical protein